MQKLLVCLSAACVFAAGGRAAEQGLTFYLSFDRGMAADFAGGDPKPVDRARQEALVPGIKGRAASFSTIPSLTFRTTGNYDNARGSLEMWLRFDKALDRAAHVFAEGTGNDLTNFRVHYHPPWQCLFCTHAQIIYSKVAMPLADRYLGRWSHFAATWDKDLGTRYYLNGQFVPHTGHSACRSPLLNYTRESRTAETFTVGPNSRYGGILVDELKIYDRMLTEAEVRSRYLAVDSLHVLLRRQLIDRQAPDLEIQVSDLAGDRREGQIRWAVLARPEDSREVPGLGEETRRPIVIEPGQPASIRFRPDVPDRTARYCVRTTLTFGDVAISRNLLFLYIADVPSARPAVPDPKLSLELLKEWDCAREYGPEEFCDDGLSTVTDSPLGRYRITAKDRHWSRFAYRFPVTAIGQPHLAEVVWPDDRTVEMEVMIDSGYGGLHQVVENGLLAGRHYPNSNELKTFRLLFWPPHEECTIMFMNWPVGGLSYKSDPVRPAAVKSVRIYRVRDGLPPTEMANLPAADRRRRVGTQDEDCSTCREYSGYALGAGVDRWIGMLLRRFDHLRFIGQNLLTHTVMHYDGALFPHGPVDRCVGKVQGYPDYFVELAMYLAEKRGIRFNAGVCYLNNRALAAEAVKTTREEMLAGKETICAIQWDGTGGPSGALGMGGKASFYNILHPFVQEHVLAFFEDFIDRYGHYPALNGIDLWMCNTHLLWFGDLKNGYSDFTVGLFEKETGTDVPGHVPDPERFVKRYLFLTKQDAAVRESWIAWRCRRTHDFWVRVHETIQRRRPGTKLVFQCWGVLGGFRYPYSCAAVWEPGNPDCVREFYRACGFDLDLFKEIPNLYLGNVLHPNINPPDASLIFRDFEFAPARVQPFRNGGRSAIWLEQHRRELDNLHSATPMPDFWLPEGTGGQPARKAGSQVRPNDELSSGALEKSGSLMANGDHYLEHYANCLADWDVREITDGGITTTTLGHEPELRDFIRAYLTLPTEDFLVFNGVDDPVCVRTWQDRFYIVNREFYSMPVQLRFSRRGFQLHDLAADARIPVNDGATVTVGPYRILSFRLPPGVTLTAANPVVPAEKITWLQQRSTEVKRALAMAENGKQPVVPRVKLGLPWFEQALDVALGRRHWFRLRKLLDSYWARNLLNTEQYQAVQRFFNEDYQQKFARTAPPLTAIRVPAVPAIDSSDWDRAPAMAELADVMFWERQLRAAPAALQTRVRCVYDDTRIGFLIDCPVKDPNKLVPAESFHKAEAVELMVSCDRDAKPYYHFKACYKGPLHEKRCYTRMQKFEKGKDYTPAYTVETEPTRKGWQARIVIPFAELDGAALPFEGAVWRVNFVRQMIVDDARCWQALRSSPKDGVHCPDLFSELRFR